MTIDTEGRTPPTECAEGRLGSTTEYPERGACVDPAGILPLDIPFADVPRTLAEVEWQHIEHVLAFVQNNKSRAAQILGLDRRTLYRKLDRMRNREPILDRRKTRRRP